MGSGHELSAGFSVKFFKHTVQSACIIGNRVVLCTCVCVYVSFCLRCMYMMGVLGPLDFYDLVSKLLIDGEYFFFWVGGVVGTKYRGFEIPSVSYWREDLCCRLVGFLDF